MPPDYTIAIMLYGLAVLGGGGLWWVYTDRRDHRFYEAQRRKISFHCVRCNHLYTARAGTDLAPCPRCGHGNVRLKF